MSRIVTPYRRAGWPRARHGSTAFHMTDQKFVDPPAGVAATPYNSKSVNFDGTNEWLQVPTVASVDFTTAVTWAAWIFVPNLDDMGSDHVWTHRSGASVVKCGLEFQDGAGLLRARIRTGTTSNFDYAGGWLESSWNLYAYTWDGTDVIVYRDGASLGSNGKAGVSPADHTGPTVGSRWNGNDKAHVFMSMCAEWKDQALTPGEMTTLYNGGVPYDWTGAPQSGSLAYVYEMGDDPLDDTTQVTDRTANGNDATCNGFSAESYIPYTPETT